MKFNRAVALILLVCGSFQINASSLSDYLENKLVDYVFRGQAFTPAATLYVGLSTAACSDSSFGTEVTGGSYSRVSISASMSSFSGTQSIGSTIASSGTAGRISNNAVVQFATPTAAWGTITHVFFADAITAGNLYLCQALTSSKTINTGDGVSFGSNALGITVN